MQAISLPIPATQLDKGKIRKGQNEKRRERKSKKGFGTCFQNERAGKDVFISFGQGMVLMKERQEREENNAESKA